MSKKFSSGGGGDTACTVVVAAAVVVVVGATSVEVAIWVVVDVSGTMGVELMSSASANGMSTRRKEVPVAFVLAEVSSGAGVCAGVDMGAGAGVGVGGDAGVELGAVAGGGGAGVDVGAGVCAVEVDAVDDTEAGIDVAVVVATIVVLDCVAGTVDDDATGTVEVVVVIVVVATVVVATASVDDGALPEISVAEKLDDAGASPTCQTSVSPTLVRIPDVAKLGGKNPPQKICVPDAYTAELSAEKEVLASAIVSGWPSASAAFCHVPRQVAG